MMDHFKWSSGLLGLCATLSLTSARAETVRLQPVSSDEARAIRQELERGTLRPAAVGKSRKVLTRDEECTAFVAGLPSSYVHGTVKVLEDESKPRGRSINVFYYGQILPGKAPVVFFNGGPASSSHGDYAILSTLPQYADHSFIFIDQRGTGCSDAFPTDPTPQTIDRLQNYGSSAIVRDSEAVRVKLFGEGSQWQVFGQSFGGLIAQRYVIKAPGSVSGSFAHGYAIMSNPDEWLALRLSSQKRVLEDYFVVYPGDRAALVKAQALVPSDLCYSDGETKVCGAGVLDALTMYLGFQTSWPSLHGVINTLVNEDDGALNTTTVEWIARNLGFGIYAQNALAGGVIGMIEMSNGKTDRESCGAALDLLRSRGETPETWIINECRVLTGIQNPTWNRLWAMVSKLDTPTLEQVRASLAANPKLSFYLYSGQKDVFVPVEVFQEEQTTLGSRITYRNFTTSGHEGFYTEAKVWEDLLAR